MSSIFDDLDIAGSFTAHLGDREPFAYTTAGGASADVVGILEMPAMMVQGLSETDIVTADVELHVAAADLPAGYGEGDTVVARGVTYRTRVPLPDGRGMVRIPLTKAS